jgi:enediyne biosynthesis protein E4
MGRKGMGVGCIVLLVAACRDEPAVPAVPGSTTTTEEGSTGVGSGGGMATVADETTQGEPGRDLPADDPGREPPPPDVGGAKLPPPPLPRFVDVTVEAGLDVDPGPFAIAPFCILDNVDGPPEPGDYCIPERFLGAAAVGDFDGDDWPDVYLSRIDGPGRLMRNQGDGTFVDVAAAAGVLPPAAVGSALWVDVEGDGDLDLMVVSFGGLQHYLYINDGTGHFTEQARPRGLAMATGEVHVGSGIAAGDYDRDGYVDLFVAEWLSIYALGHEVDHNRLLRNRGAEAPGHFEDVTEAMGIDLQRVTANAFSFPGAYGFAPAFVDLDGDGWTELTLVADFGTSRLWWNDGVGGFFDGTVGARVGLEDNGMGSTFGDIDGDGMLDWFATSIGPAGSQFDGNRMYRNRGDRSFDDVTDALGVRNSGWSWGAAMLDVDHDGDLDLALAAGWPTSPFAADPVRLWLNDHAQGGAGPWPDVAPEAGVLFARQGRGIVPLDYDRDGDLDLLVVANTEIPALFRNEEPAGAWLEVRAAGRPGNPASLGARVRVQVHAGGPWQLREMGVGSHLFGQAENAAHFGLGSGTEPVHCVEVTWPASGEQVVLHEVARDQRIVVVEGAGS